MKKMVLRRIFCFMNFSGFLLCCFPAIAQDNQPEPASSNPQKIIQHFYSSVEAYKDRQVPDLEFRLGEKQTLSSLTELKGKSVLLLFWAVNCGPCKPEMAKTSRLQAQFADSGLVVIYLTEDPPETQNRYFKKHPFNGLKAHLSSQKPEPPFYSPLIPRTYLVDRRGHLRHAWIGSETIDSVENKIRELLFD